MMKSKSILQQEEEFLKLNEEIELTTKDLMDQVDRIKLGNEELYADIPKGVDEKDRIGESRLNSSEEDFALREYFSTRKEDSDDGSHRGRVEGRGRGRSKQSHSAKVTPSVVGAQGEESGGGLSLGVVRHKSDAGERKLESEVIPETLKGVGQDGITRFLSAKVKILSQQLEVVQRDERKHLERIKELQAEKEKSTEEREKLRQQVNLSRSALVKLEQHADSVAAQLQTAQTENSHLKKELEALRKEIRQNSKNYNASEMKLNRTLEETEKLRAALQQVKQEEKECRETQRKKIETLTSALKKLDRQRTELLNGFKKQLLIIDNLKRQKDLIEAGKLLKGAEDDFSSYLDCNPTNTAKTGKS